jgi:hypothetical protein
MEQRSRLKTVIGWMVSAYDAWYPRPSLTGDENKVKEGIRPGALFVLGLDVFAIVVGVEGLNECYPSLHLGGQGNQEQPEPMVLGPLSGPRKGDLYAG